MHKPQHQHRIRVESPSSKDGDGGGNKTIFKVRRPCIDQVPTVPLTGINHVKRVSTMFSRESTGSHGINWKRVIKLMSHFMRNHI